MLHTGPVDLSLENAEALVLFEFLARSSERRPPSYLIEHQAEQRILWDLQAMLESRLVEPLRADYDELVRVARAAIADPE